ncbi:hypothetical protein RBE51_20860 [Pseudomonas taiwanensis]|uniref:hypothetical protein n=1 Tax=Pseudomonas taiwanensis TaxID=470150 RepID=UPI0028DE5334|nr:hypothetical protein [Pseudomonas taiwanensis]MDT8925248.1 hypothetical protein [Pseudomonas taiwanensis]
MELHVPQLDETPISLNPDQDAVLQRTVKEIQQNLGSLLWFKSQDTNLTRGVASSVLNITEGHIKTLGELLEVATQAAADSEQRHAELRRANMEIHRLEALIGGAQDLASVQLAIAAMVEQLNGWWSLDGFGHVRDVYFGQYNCKADFSCRLFGHYPLTNSATPISDKEQKALWEQSLVDRGFVLFDGRDGDGQCLRDCQTNRDLLKALFAQRLPSARIHRFVSHEAKNGSVLDGLEVYIRKIEQIKTLPVPPPELE